MNEIEFTRVAGKGFDALYNLCIDGELVKSNITLDEVITEISNKYERAGENNDG